MINSKNIFLRIFLILFLIVFLCSCDDKKTQFTSSEQVIELPFNFNTETLYTSIIIIDKDTINAMLDTGYTSSSFSKIDFTKKDFLDKSRVKDFRGVIKDIPIVRVKKIDWGGLHIENLEILKLNKNIIGADVLENFCVKLDNYNRKILLSLNPNLIEKKGIKIPFHYTKLGEIIFPLQLENKTSEFILDTGYSDEILVDSLLFNSSKLATSKYKKWCGKFLKSTFMSDWSDKNEIDYRTMADLHMGNKIFKDVSVCYMPNLNKKGNYVGSVFLRRFASVTIDYINKNLYFELPQNIELPNDEKLDFSNKKITAHPIEYLNILYRYYNSFDFRTTFYPPFVIKEIEVGSTGTKNLSIGDTLVGVDNTIFSKKVFKKLQNKSQYVLNLNKEKSIKKLVTVIFRKSIANFHFLKNGKIITVKAKRNQFLTPSPFVGYAFEFRAKDLRHYGHMNFYVDYKVQKMSFHFPWETLSNREIKVNGFDDKNENIPLTNKSPK